jgi:protocatechuate 3,4-dioxygenase beta subunit
MCKYGKLQGVLLWVNSDDLGNVGKIASRLEQEIRELGPKRVRVFMIYMNPDRKPRPELEALLSSWAADASLKHVAVTYVPSPTDEKSSVLYRINPDPRVKNTVFVYRKRRIVDKFVNLHADDDSLARLVRSVESAAASG